jgi:rod shape-determining protein MreC
MRYGGDSRGRLLLIILIVTSLLLITLDLRGVGVIDGIRNGAQTAITPVQKVGSFVVSPFRNFLSDVTHLGRTRNQIARLKAENESLKLELLNRKEADAQLKQLKSVLNLAGKAGYKVVAAKVISQGSSSSFTQTLTVDAGSSDGIRKNMTVISGLGIVGVVKVALPHSSIIQLASDPAFRIGARMANTQQIGILSGQGTRRGFLQLLDNSEVVKVGDAVVARGSANNNPFVPGIPIGEVVSVENAAGSVTQTAEVKFYTNFSTLGLVSIVLKAPKSDPHDSLVPVKPSATPTPTVTVTVTPSPSSKG